MAVLTTKTTSIYRPSQYVHRHKSHHWQITSCITCILQKHELSYNPFLCKCIIILLPVWICTRCAWKFKAQHKLSWVGKPSPFQSPMSTAVLSLSILHCRIHISFFLLHSCHKRGDGKHWGTPCTGCFFQSHTTQQGFAGWFALSSFKTQEAASLCFTEVHKH